MTTQANRESIAARWLIEQDDPEFSDEQRDALARWLVGSVENCSAYLRLVRAWRRTALLHRNEMPLVYGVRRQASAGKPAAARRGSEPRRAPRPRKRAVRERRVQRRRRRPYLERTRLPATSGKCCAKLALRAAGLKQSCPRDLAWTEPTSARSRRVFAR